jgi:DNA-binding MarR family transcriptional regulator
MTTNNAGSPAGDESAASGRFAYDGLDRVFHEKARLGILTSLVAHPRGLVFADLKELCALTDGNLSRHLQVLHEAGFVEINKGFERNRPQTLCLLTAEGRRRFLEYINVLESVVADALAASRSQPMPMPAPKPRRGKRIAGGWSPA